MSVSVSVRLPDVTTRNMICRDEVTPIEIMGCLGITDHNNYLVFFDGLLLDNETDMDTECKDLLESHDVIYGFNFSHNHLMRICSIKDDYGSSILPFGVEDEVVAIVPQTEDIKYNSRTFIAGFESEMNEKDGCVGVVTQISADTYHGRYDVFLEFPDGYTAWWDSMWVEPHPTRRISDSEFDAMIEEVYEVER